MDPQVSVALVGIVASVITSVLGQVAGYLLILRWIIRRQVDGNWVLRIDMDQQLADKQRQIDSERELRVEWKNTYLEEARAGRVKDDTINKAVQANKISDHFYETVMPKNPRSGDNDSQGVAP